MGFQRHVLSNGLRVVSEDIPYVRSVAVGVWVKTGSRYETPSQHGVTHFLEHLMFKGTPTRTARQMAEQMDAIGGQMNAFTAKEYTCFYARVLSDHLPFAIELLADMLTRSVFGGDDLVREKSVVLEEIKLYEDTPDELIHDLCAQAVLGRHPLGRPILGTTETVSALERADVIEFWRGHYTPDNIVISVAGQFDAPTVHQLVEQHFGRMTGHHREMPEVPFDQEAGLLLCEKETEQIHFCLGTHGLPRGSKDRFAVQVLDALLGGSVSSRLFQELREERGLVYSTFSSHASYEETGLFSVYLGASPENLKEAVDLVKCEYDSVRDGHIREDEVSRAKEQLRGSVLFGLESTSTRMSRLAKCEMFFGELLPTDDLIKLIQSVTSDDVIRVARNVLAQKPSIAAIGPIQSAGVDLNSLAALW